MNTHAPSSRRGRRLAAVAFGLVLALIGGGAALATIPDRGHDQRLLREARRQSARHRRVEHAVQELREPAVLEPDTPTGAQGSRRPTGTKRRSG
jgi:hypothetical protein